MTPAVTRSAMTAVRAAAAAPVLDGRLDDAVWQHAAPATDFTIFEPNAGAPSSQRTEARVAYDDRAIYVAVRMYDTSPDSIVAQLARRDQQVHSDWIMVAIDSYYDRRTAFVFGVNPRGVKVDILIYDDRMESVSWDAIWEAATATDSLGWTAEFRIPLSQLRFGSSDEARVWGIQFYRQIGRSRETSFWAPVPRDADGLVSRFGELHGLRGLTPPRNMELLPYSVAQVTRAPGDAANPFHRDSRGSASAGADLKVGVTSDLTLNATINPDFGQVEADPSIVNLSAFETFLPEKRPFFVEGANIYNFAIGLGDGDMGNEALFYSRRIGRRPQGAVPSAAEFSDMPTASTIVSAAKLSGRTAGGWSVGVLDAVTAEERADYALADGSRGRTVVEPWTNYAVARVMRDFDGGNSTIGAIATATNRSLTDELTSLRSAAYSGGINAWRRFGGGNYQFKAWLVGSHIRGDTSAIAIAQRSAARYYQRPDNEHVTYDATRTSLGGWAANAEVFKMGGGHWRYATMLNVRSPGFEVNDLGYMQSADQVLQVAFIGYDQFRATPRFQRWNVNVNQWAGWNFGGDPIALGTNINGGLQLPNFWGANGGINHERSVVRVAALRSGPALRTQPTANAWLGVYSDSRRPLRMSLNGNISNEFGTTGGSWGINTSATVRAANRAEISLSPSYSRSRNETQYVTRRTANGAPRYILGQLEQSTTALTARVSYTVTPTLSVQLYAQPFISAGHYPLFREVTDARAVAFDDRFHTYAPAAVQYDADADVYRIDRTGDGVADLSFADPDFNFKQMRSNAVVRWEYRPGSALFVVWGHGRTRADDHGTFRFGRDAGDLWDAAGSNVLMIKLSYWLGL
ncbi:MAG TPA: DUF5916 domain-containing protein [Longimicrobiales bacterium]|nr:DUF5916 domain-containing protein [Longimicrobiales bacterium]